MKPPVYGSSSWKGDLASCSLLTSTSTGINADVCSKGTPEMRLREFPIHSTERLGCVVYLVVRCAGGPGQRGQAWWGMIGGGWG